MQCQCGSGIDHAFLDLECLECGQPCCPTCAIALESATYCRDCAADLLDAPQVKPAAPFDLI